jgi:hypothetical protein
MPDVPPPLAHAILDHVAADWPDFALIRPAASSLQSKARLPQAISMAVNELRVALASAALGHGLSATRLTLSALRKQRLGPVDC